MQSQEATLSNLRTKGIILVLMAAIFWGISGTVAQFLFQQQGFSAEWLVDIRLLCSGIILILYSKFGMKRDIWSIWKNKKDIFELILFGVFGMLGVQYTYFVAIEYGNAATATVLQYIAPVLITCYLCIQSRKFPAKNEVLAVFLALVGTFLLVTNGNIQTLSITKEAFFWGIASAFALAFYTIQPAGLLFKWGSLNTVGWGMLIGGIGFSFIHPPWVFQGQWTLPSLLAVIFVVIFGTLIAFFCYLESTKYIRASETSLLACAEPLSAAFLAVVWLHVPFGIGEWIGTFCIMLTIFLLAVVKR
jgi:drug/metabolite transporter (DMT)-like permease